MGCSYESLLFEAELEESLKVQDIFEDFHTYETGGCWYCGRLSPLDSQDQLHCRNRKCTDFQATPEGEKQWREYFRGDIRPNEAYVPMVNAHDFDWEADAKKPRRERSPWDYAPY